MNNLQLIDQYEEFLLIPDSIRTFLMTGVFKAAEWIDGLDDKDFTELNKALISLIENGTDKDLIDLIFVAQACDKKDLKSTAKELVNRGYGKDNEDVKMYSNNFLNPSKEGSGVQIDSKWGMRTNKQVRGQKKKRGSKD